MTTREKIQALIAALRETPAEDAQEGRHLVELVQIMAGLGFDPLAYLLPDTDAEADMLVDKVIALLLQLRGDDLPPFDPDLYGEAVET